MLKSFKVYNFRCFQAVDLGDLRRINLIVGPNAAGKTALMEALRLGLTGTPQALFQMNPSRGFFTHLIPPINREQFESIWNLYFYNMQSDRPILTECVDEDGRKATLKVSYDPKKSVTQVPPASASSSQIATIVPLVFDRTNFRGQLTVLQATLHTQGPLAGQLNIDTGQELSPVTDLSLSLQGAPQFAAQWFSRLSQQNREQEVIDAVKRAYGGLISDIVVLSPGQIVALYAELPHMAEKLPLSLVSAGVSKFVAVISAIIARADSVILIDEIESGIYFDKFASFWETLLHLSLKYNAQVFASTHSQECIRSLLAIMKGKENEFSLLRAERKNGASGVRPISGDLFEAAIEQQFEVR